MRYHYDIYGFAVTLTFLAFCVLVPVLFILFRRKKLAVAAWLSLPFLLLFGSTIVASYWKMGDISLHLVHTNATWHESWDFDSTFEDGEARLYLYDLSYVLDPEVMKHTDISVADPASAGIGFDKKFPESFSLEFGDRPWVHRIPSFAGFHLTFCVLPNDGQRQLLAATPGWFVVAVLAICPLAWLLRRLIQKYRHRHPPGHCRKCGFDLRAHKPGEKCPECGTVIPEPPKSPSASPPAIPGG